MISRRRLVIALGASALAAPSAAFAQQRSKVARIGFLYFATRQSALDSGRYDAFLKGMREFGYVIGTNLVIEERFADNQADRVAALADEFVRLKVDVIVATGGALYRPLQLATTSIPIVITIVADPVAAGLAKSLARPGGNITGVAGAPDPGPKLLELLTALVLKMSRVGVLLNPDSVSHPPQLLRIMSAAQDIGIQTVLAQAATAPEIEPKFAMLARERVGGVIILNDAFFLEQVQHIAAQAIKNNLPSIFAIHDYARAGGLMSYGPNQVDNFRLAASYVDKILKGANPGELPFQQPTRYYLAINQKTARALGVTIPQSVLLRVDEVIR